MVTRLCAVVTKYEFLMSRARVFGLGDSYIADVHMRFVTLCSRLLKDLNLRSWTEGGDFKVVFALPDETELGPSAQEAWDALNAWLKPRADAWAPRVPPAPEPATATVEPEAAATPSESALPPDADPAEEPSAYAPTGAPAGD